MSSRSKEKALNAFRKLFKGSGASGNNNNSNQNNQNNNNNNNSNNNHHSSSASNNNHSSSASHNNNTTNNNNNNNTTSSSSNKAEECATSAAMAATAATGTSTTANETTTNAATRETAALAAGGSPAVAAAAAVVGGAALPSDSPGKRLRRQDNKISPASSKMSMGSGGAAHPPDFSIRARRLMKEYKEIQKIQNCRKEAVFTVELINDSLYEWHARLHIVDPDSRLAKDMMEMNIPFILLHLVFPDNFPFAPPFMRVVEPRIEKGFVMEGGAICMELLTPRGWASAYTVEAVLMQFAASLVKGQGRIVRKPKSSKEFSRRTAEEAFRSLVKTHDKYGWVTPALSDG